MNVEKLFKWAGISALVLAFSCQGDPKKETGSTSDASAPPSIGCNLDTIIIAPNVPHEVDVQLGQGYQGLTPTIQPCFDIFSWQTFVALNWPADSIGNPMGSSFTANPNAQRVWEDYTDPSVVFQTNESLLPFTGPFKKESGFKGLHMFSKLSHELMNLPESIAEATGQPLIDKNLNFALYEIKLNKDEVNYIVKDSLTTTEGQAKVKHIQFPSGSDTGAVGAMEIKATWKILVPGVDSVNNFYKKMAVIYVPADQSITGVPLYLKEWVGLVSMHIIHKTTRFPFWVWSTFEHIDNAPEQSQVSNAGNNFSFFNPACTNCVVDTPPTAPSGNIYIWQATKPYAKTYATNGQYGTQVVRKYPVYGPTEAVNKKWQQALANAGSVFANYRLIGSQWSIVSDGAPPFDTIPAPDTLSNTTLETYIQNSSCTMTCHRFATDAVGTKSDFSFILGHARSTAFLRSLKKKK